MSNVEDFNWREYIEYARQLSTVQCRYTKALDLYLMAFEKHPDAKYNYEDEFRVLLGKLNEMLASANKTDEIFNNFSRANVIFPGNMYLMNDLGKYLFKFGFYLEAWSQFQKALMVDGAFVNAEKNLNSVKNCLVERWHFRMLNDDIRNDAYHSSIKEIVKSDDIVFDLGSGTGLLSLYVSECKPKFITACDSSEVMANISNLVLSDAVDKDNKYLVINKKSTELTENVNNKKHTILVTELFDAGLFGEHVLPALSHAWKNFLHVDARIIPSIAKFYIIGAQCKELMSKYQVCSSVKKILNISPWNIHVLQNEDTYDCEDIYMFKNLKYMTNSECVLSVDFNNVNSIDDILENSEPINVELTPRESGEVNCYIGWFNLILSGAHTLTTDPRSSDRATAWQQAIFYDFLPKHVDKGGKFNCEFSFGSGKLSLIPDLSVTRISPEAIRFLNDTELMNNIMNCLGLVCVYLGQIMEISTMSIIDLSPFPMFGFQMLKRGAKSLVCWARTELDQQFIEEVFKINKIDLSKVTYLIGDDWGKHSFGKKKYHAIFCIMLEPGGDIDEWFWEICQYLKQSHLSSEGLFLPHKVSVIAQIAQCNWLNITNRVYDENVGYPQISEHINKFQVSQNFGIDYSLLDYTALTMPVELGDVSNMVANVLSVPVVENGDANCILCWYNIELLEGLGEMSTKRPCCFIDGTAFLANPSISMRKGDVANILHCADPDGSLKMMIDLEAIA
ncbi:unnamed protein product [Leptidea sinapis]|uniref:Methyltransferase domain-containing protein n=1 Tax=Leptidea sinapis TaxID=189913 RepID=A0A5E4QEB3_9NEOP|nr:unnamed protein product [Leptidea sinapis]